MSNKKSIKVLSSAFFLSILLHAGIIFWISQGKLTIHTLPHIKPSLLDDINSVSEQEMEKSIEIQLAQFSQTKAPLEEVFIPLQSQIELPLNPELEIFKERSDPLCSSTSHEVNLSPHIFSDYLNELESPSLLDNDFENGTLSTLSTSDIPLSDFEPLSNLRDLSRGVSNEDFEIALEYSPKRFKPGYVFKITLTPKKELSFKKMRQHFFFLIDRSNSIPKERYELFKRSVADSLRCLTPEDTFNILVFDDKIVRLSNNPLPWCEENCKVAEYFLQKQPHGGFLAATDIYSSLGKIIPHEVVDNEVNTAILLSDGDTYLNLEKKRAVIGQWTKLNQGKVSLFCVATAENNNLPLLELLSHFNRGSLHYSSETTYFQEKFIKLIQSLGKPIGKSLHATAITHDDTTKVFLYPPNHRLPHFYEKRPLVLVGSINRLSDFTLIIQGRHYEKPFRIKKTVSFNQGLKGTLSLERQCVQYVAEEYYELFFRDGKLSHLEEAKNLLQPFNLTPSLR